MTAKNNHIKIAYPNPLILFSVEIAILYESATKIKFKKEPTTKSSPKLKIAADLNKPYKTNGIPKPNTKLKVKEMDIPKY